MKLLVRSHWKERRGTLQNEAVGLGRVALSFSICVEATFHGSRSHRSGSGQKCPVEAVAHLRNTLRLRIGAIDLNLQSNVGLVDGARHTSRMQSRTKLPSKSELAGAFRLFWLFCGVAFVAISTKDRLRSMGVE